MLRTATYILLSLIPQMALAANPFSQADMVAGNQILLEQITGNNALNTNSKKYISLRYNDIDSGQNIFSRASHAYEDYIGDASRSEHSSYIRVTQGLNNFISRSVDGAGNQQHLLVNGDNNQLFTQISGNYNLINAQIIGESNTASITQNGNNYIAHVLQQGSRNTATIVQGQ